MYNFNSLPDEVIGEILARCNETDSSNLRLINKRCLKLCNFYLNQKFFIKNESKKIDTDPFHRQLCRLLSLSHISLKQLILERIDFGRHKFKKKLFGKELSYYAANNNVCKSIVKLELVCCTINKGSLFRIRRLLPNIQAISLVDCTLEGGAISSSRQPEFLFPVLKELYVCWQEFEMFDYNLIKWMVDNTAQITSIKFTYDCRGRCHLGSGCWDWRIKPLCDNNLQSFLLCKPEARELADYIDSRKDRVKNLRVLPLR